MVDIFYYHFIRIKRVEIINSASIFWKKPPKANSMIIIQTCKGKVSALREVHIPPSVKIYLYVLRQIYTRKENAGHIA